MGGVAPNSPVSAANTNPAFIDANDDDTTIGRITLANTLPVSGPQVDSIQKDTNGLNSYTGRPSNDIYNSLPTWVDTSIGTPTDSLVGRAEAATRKFNPTHTATDGHSHDGTAGQGEKIIAINIDAVPLFGYSVVGTQLTAITGTSTVVTTEMTGKTPSSGSSVEGVVVTAPYNKVIIRDPISNNPYEDGSGNQVYGRITEAATVWTLSYYVDIAGTETAYNFTVASDIAWWYQELFNPLGGNAPVYSENFFTPSDNAAADVPDATATQRGLVSASAQTLGGQKTFNANPILNALTAGSVLFLNSLKEIAQAASNFFWDEINNRLGLGTNSPNTTLDLNGDFASRRTDVASAATITALTTTTSLVKLTGATATEIQGIASGFDGKRVILFNGSSATITVKHQNAGATAADRIITPDALDLLILANRSTEFVYDSNQSRWVVASAASAGTTYRSGSDSISNAVSTKAVTFSTAMPNTNYSISANISNLTDTNPQFIPLTVSVKSTTGFTVIWNTATDSANYVLEWSVIAHN